MPAHQAYGPQEPFGPHGPSGHYAQPLRGQLPVLLRRKKIPPMAGFRRNPGRKPALRAEKIPPMRTFWTINLTFHLNFHLKLHQIIDYLLLNHKLLIILKGTSSSKSGRISSNYAHFTSILPRNVPIWAHFSPFWSQKCPNQGFFSDIHTFNLKLNFKHFKAFLCNLYQFQGKMV